MTHMMRTYAPSQATGLPADQYDGMGLMITRYLAGAQDEFQYWLDDGFGRQTPVFQEHEQQHMADCRGLFVLDRVVLVSCAVGITAMMALLLFLREKRLGALGALIGGCLAITLVGALGVWAAVDFDSLFILFHHLSFSNDLWLLDPHTDMLIRLMPLDFFMTYVLYIGVTWLLFLWGWIAASALCMKKPGRKNR